MRAAISTAASILFAGCLGCGPVCGDTVARIEALGSGELLTLDAACVIDTSVTVPSGAHVIGGTFELGADAMVRLTPSLDASVPTTIASARVLGGATRAAILVEGPGFARVENIDFVLERGVGLAAVGGAEVTVDGLTLTGNVDPARLIELPNTPPPDRFATYGIVALDGASITLLASPTVSRIERFASAAVGCGNATLSLADASLSENRVGVLSVGCTVTLTRVEIAETLASPGVVGMGIAASGSELSGAALFIHDAPGYGLFATDSRCTIVGSRVERLEQAGLWAEGLSTLRIDDCTLSGNRGAAIAAVGAIELEVTASRVEDTRLAPIPIRGGLAAEDMGDAIHVAHSGAGRLVVALDGVTLAGNERVGLVIDGGEQPMTITIGTLAVDAPGTALGAVAQRVTSLPPDWDTGVTRVTSSARDLAAAALTVSDGSPVGILMPPTLAP